MQHFTTQLRHEQNRTRSLRASQYHRARRNKDKRKEDESLADLQADDETQPDAIAQSYASSTAPGIAQLRVAGLLPSQEDKVPPPPFPHAPASVSKQHNGPAKVQEEMARPPSRLYAVHASSKGGAVQGHLEAQKRAHLDSLSTLMHCCLLKGDYERAGRAWGMILRTQVAGGRPVDPRNHGRWGIGAEIALRRTPQTLMEHRFSPEGFELAREYYNRLIIQHPTRKLQPHAVDERTFYPPMFSLWIYEVREKSKRARQQLHDDVANQSRSSRSTSVDSNISETPDNSSAKEATIQAEELNQALEIAKRLDQVISSPPFDKQASLLELRGHISLWVSDLTMGDMDTHADWAMNPSTHSSPAPEQLKRLAKAHHEVLAAQAFLERAVANGAESQAATLSSINIKRRSLVKTMEQLRTAR
ncbi:hypothetical protein J4E83_004504 [Alternaria metachromatica]|uniref:uncharacterized protein n=1 Tax=Alternaria metachromatica TaxID=283354 RepID=UPI0020C2E1E9|nr:uncharacterized protein J4E83_004504 [Alternaria metachromatica]XP_049248475.1 uncharacterized protein J4E84_000315 [Alternaria hordeiaustralica]KAI4623113.1 hypothetical protein J4E83_004504 [Alternaria metachromatica]KAI4697189.1 hypothetical protein J4E84_000315 [Alternaria hordeiaustralica]